MKYLLDIECTVVFDGPTGRSTDPSPYDHNNRLVSIGWICVDTGEEEYVFFDHKEGATPGAHEKVTEMLSKAKLIIGHNLKFDMSWLLECGYEYNGAYHDTMIFEYVCAKGQKLPLSLSACAERYGLESKSDILGEYLARKINVNEIPKLELLEYGLQDIRTTLQLYNHQRKRYLDDKDVRTMWTAIKLSNEALEVLIDMERNGIRIDIEALNQVDADFRAEKEELEANMRKMIHEVMGDTPINLSSPEDMSKVVYGVVVTDKKAWASELNIGTEMRGSVRKTKYVRRLRPDQFQELKDKYLRKVYRTKVSQCQSCQGKGTILKVKKNGEPFARPNRCPSCGGSGFIYTDTERGAGFRLTPPDSTYATTNGFATDKGTIKDLIEQGYASGRAQDFLMMLQRVNAIDTYLSAFVEGMRKSIRSDGLSHPNFNQCVTATGRLSSSGPNWQNQPRGSTFPVRKTVVSRWKDGFILDADFSALEYRTAVALAGCKPGLDSILNGKDRHQLTAEVLFDVKKENVPAHLWDGLRQDAKPDTFAPLYGSNSSDPKRAAYRIAFFAEHTGIANWHEKLCEEALTYKQITTPSGRIFAFPNAERIDRDRVLGKTQIVNYPVQSFATADIAWCVIVELYRLFKQHNIKSKLILQVHDSVVADVHPEERELVLNLFNKAFSMANQLIKERFNFDTPVPIGYEMAIGENLMNKKKVA